MLSKNKIIIIIVVGVIIIIGGIVGITIQSKDTAESDTSTYVDQGSGEEIIDSKNAPQGTDASLKNAIIYPGFSKLIDRGLSAVQIQSIQTTIADYSAQQDNKFNEVSLTTSSMRHILPQGASKTHTITFDIVTNRKDTHYVTVDYENTDSCITKLYAADKTTLLIER